MNVVYFETNYKNGLIYILMQNVEVKNNEMLLDSRNWVSSLTYNSTNVENANTAYHAI